jgi:hypothetical protein
VNGNIEAHHTAGGLAGVSLGVITDSYANVLGNISVGKSWGGSSTAGGIVGVAYGAISNAHATISGSILASGDYAGGIAGQANDSITNSYALINGVITGENYIGGIAGESAGIQNSYTQISGDIFGLSYVGGLTGKNHNGINNSSAIVLGSIAGQDFTGGLVGDARSSVSGSYSSIAGNVSGNNYTGGLAGKVDSHDVVNSFLSVGGSISGSSNTGGFIGQTDGDILNSIGYIGGGITGSDYVGGLTGQAGAGVILNTDIKVVGSVTGDDYVGGLSGYFANNFEGPHIDNSDIEIRGVLLGNSDVGQLIGRFFGGNIVSSYVSLGGMIGGTSDSDLFGYIYPHNSRTTSYTDTEKVWDISNLPAFPSFLQTINQGLTPTKFATNVCLNQGMPYLIQRSTSYANSCTSGSNSRKNRFRTSVEARKVTKIESPIGFKNEISPSKALSFSFLSLREKIDLVKIKFVEISPKDNVKVTKKAGEALQISLKSEGKEPAELWVASPDGSWLLAGMITFDKDGKAILPPLQFKNAGDYTLVLNKPTEGSSKGSEPLNQTGSLLVEVI